MPAPHRKRRKVFDTPGHAHFLTFNCYHKRDLLESDTAKQFFVDAIDRARANHPFELWAWVAMSNHAHLLIRPHCGIGISAILKNIKLSTAKRTLNWYRENAPTELGKFEAPGIAGSTIHRLWERGGGFDRNCYTADSLRYAQRYIHDNPVEAGLVAAPEDYHWSSARAWITDEPTPIPVDCDSFMISVSGLD